MIECLGLFRRRARRRSSCPFSRRRIPQIEVLIVVRSKVALVTGSGKQRVGWHVAAALAARGYALAVHYHSSTAEAVATVDAFRAGGVEAVAFQADLTKEHSARG